MASALAAATANAAAAAAAGRRPRALPPPLLLLAGAALLVAPACAWGGLFNRFSPEMLSNLGYGGHGYRASSLLNRYAASPAEALQELQEAAAAEEEPCYGKVCTANEHCCPGYICVDMDGIVGSCLFPYGLKQGELCRRDDDCETGLLCADGATGRTCQPPASSRKHYGEDCATSSDCDAVKGLCCQLQRRHRQAPRKVCSYYKDPLICIGPVAAGFVRDDMQRTAGEKRLTGRDGPFAHLRRK